MSNGLDQDQDRRYVGPDLGPNCLQRLSADDTCRQRVKHLLGEKRLMNINMRLTASKLTIPVRDSLPVATPVEPSLVSFKRELSGLTRL